MHLNPSRHKIPFQHRKAAVVMDSSIPTHDNISSSSSLSKLHLPSCSLSQSQSQNPDLAEDNRLLRLRLDQLKQANRELLRTLLGKEHEIDKVGEEYKQLMFRYRSEMQRTNLKLRALLREDEQGAPILRSKALCSPRDDPAKNHKALAIKEMFDGLDFREVERLASSRHNAPHNPENPL